MAQFRKFWIIFFFLFSQAPLFLHILYLNTTMYSAYNEHKSNTKYCCSYGFYFKNNETVRKKTFLKPSYTSLSQPRLLQLQLYNKSKHIYHNHNESIVFSEVILDMTWWVGLVIAAHWLWLIRQSVHHVMVYVVS